MTIPIIPGPFSALGQGLNAGLESFNAERQRQYEQANAGARLILGLAQSGMIDPQRAFADPQFQNQLAAAKIPGLNAGAIVPSAPAEKARRIAGRAAKAEPGSVEEDVLFDIPGEGQISQSRLETALNNFKLAAAGNPALARMMTNLIPGDIAQGRETAARASIDRPGYNAAAEDFVSQAGLAMPKTPTGQLDFQQLVGNAKALAAADPQYRDLVANGQLSDEYFARAARGWQRLTEEDRIKYADIAARRAAAERQMQNFYGVQDRSYDTDIQRLQKTIDLNKPGEFDPIFLPSIAEKVNRGEKLNAGDQLIWDRAQARAQAQAQIDQLQGERSDLRDRAIGRQTPVIPGQAVVPPSGAAAQARRPGPAAPVGTTNPRGRAAQPLEPRLQSAVDLLRSGQGTRAQLDATTAFTPEEKKRILDAAGIK